MSALIKWTLWQRRWAIFWWAVGVLIFIVLNLAFYPSVRDQTSQLNQSFNQVPESAKVFISDTGDFFSPQGYLSSQVFYLMLPMLLTILAVNLGSSLIAKEENDGTLELLLSRPITRLKLLAAKAAAGILILLIVGLIALVSIVILSWLVDINVGLGDIARASLMSIILALLFGAISFFVTTLGRTARLASIGIAVLVALGGYIISSLASIVSWMQWPAKVMPYHYYRPGDILGGHFSLPNALGILGVTIVLGILSWIAFRRRDIIGS